MGLSHRHVSDTSNSLKWVVLLTGDVLINIVKSEAQKEWAENNRPGPWVEEPEVKL